MCATNESRLHICCSASMDNGFSASLDSIASWKWFHYRTQVYHMGPGNAFSIDERPHHERQEVLKTQAIIKERCGCSIEDRGGAICHVRIKNVQSL